MLIWFTPTYGTPIFSEPNCNVPTSGMRAWMALI
tara:strand:+ start:198 stop:299 length:102 start_codon:yes stop_codon:yes gene_type:complete